MKPVALWSAMLLTLLVFGCDYSPSNFEGGDPLEKESSLMAPPAIQNSPKREEDNTKLIKTAFLELTVDDLAKARKEIAQVATGFDSYMLSDNQSNYPDQLVSQQVIRVPARRFDELLAKIETLGTKTDQRTVQVTDVTEEFVDTQARIKAKKNLESRYYEILKKATKVEDMLSIEEQLNNVRTDIERMEGRINFLTNQVAFSTIRVNCSQPLVSDFGFGHKFLGSLVKGWEVLLRIILSLTALWPVVIGIAVVVYLIKKRSPFFVKKVNSSNSPS